MSPKVYMMPLAILLIAGVLISSNQVLAQDSQGDLLDLASQCEQFVSKSGARVSPSQDCCAVVNRVDLPCVCKLFTKEIEDLISMKKVVYVAQACGKTVPPGTKCGSYTVPSGRRRA